MGTVPDWDPVYTKIVAWLGRTFPQRRILNFVGKGVKGVFDDINTSTTTVHIAGAGSSLVGIDGVDVDEERDIVRTSRDYLDVDQSTDINELSGFGLVDILRLNPSVHINLVALQDPGADDTHRILIVNCSTTRTATVKHEYTSETNERARFYCPHQVDYELRPFECVFADYDYGNSYETRRWRLLTNSKPFHLIRTKYDLPEISSNVRTLTTNSGIWYFANLVTDDAGVQLDVYQGATVWAAPDCGYSSSHATNAAVKVRNTHNYLPFKCANTGGGPSWECFTLSPQTFSGWISTSNNVACSSLVVRMTRCEFIRMIIPRSVDDVRIDNCTGAVVISATNGSGTVGWVEMNNCWNLYYAGPMMQVEAGMAVRYRLGLYQCLATSQKLLDSGANLNDGGVFPQVFINGGCYSSAVNSITCGVVPAGGMVIMGNTLNATAFSGFTELTTGVISRANRSTGGSLLRETPNGHIVRNNAGTDLTQTHYLRAGTGIQATTSGSETVLSCTVASVGTGAANTLLQMNSAGNATEWELLFNANVDPNALIAVDKLAKSAAQHSVLVSNAAANSFSTDPEVDKILVYEAANFRITGDPGDPSEGAWVHYHGSDANLVARFENTYRHDLAPDNPTEGGVDSMAKHFHEKYTFSRSAGSGAYTFLTEGYISPFGMTHGTSQVLNVRGWVALDVLVAGTPGGTETWRFWAHFNSGGTLHTLFFWQEEYNGTGSGTPTTNPSGTGLTIAEVSEQIAFGISNPAVDVRIMVELIGHCWTAEAP